MLARAHIIILALTQRADTTIIALATKLNSEKAGSVDDRRYFLRNLKKIYIFPDHLIQNDQEMRNIQEIMVIKHTENNLAKIKVLEEIKSNEGSATITILSRINRIPRIETYLFKIHSNIVLPSTPRL